MEFKGQCYVIWYRHIKNPSRKKIRKHGIFLYWCLIKNLHEKLYRKNSQSKKSGTWCVNKLLFMSRLPPNPCNNLWIYHKIISSTYCSREKITIMSNCVTCLHQSNTRRTIIKDSAEWFNVTWGLVTLWPNVACRSAQPAQ
jgi:hypothetical protein